MKIQYRDKEIIILSGVYEPAEDSFLMVEAVLREVQRSDSILEIGTGSGIVSIEDMAQVIATDISPRAVKCAKLNGIDVISNQGKIRFNHLYHTCLLKRKRSMVALTLHEMVDLAGDHQPIFRPSE